VSINCREANSKKQAKKLIQTAAQYALGMSIELERRKLTSNQADLSSLSEDTRKRALELSAYFTVAKMEPAYVTLALYAAMNLAHKNKQLSSALSFANALIEKGTNAKYKETVSFSPMSRGIQFCINSIQRRRKSRPSPNATLLMPLKSNMTNLPSLTSAPLRTLQFIAALQAQPVRLTA
jgi:hypothetical protein